MSDSATARRARWREPQQWRLWLQGLFGVRYDGLAHFAVVDPGALMRSGQPRLRDLEYIRTTYGLKTIIAARGGVRHPLRGRWFQDQRRWCAANQVRFEHVPLTDHDTPPDEFFGRVLEIYRDRTNYPILVHCEQGFHRTGVLCAAYRVAVNRWPLDRALEEMHRRGYSPDDEKRRPLYAALLRWADESATSPGA